MKKVIEKINCYNIKKRFNSILSKIYSFFEYRIHVLENSIDAPVYFKTYRSLSKEKKFKRFPGGWIYNNRKYPDYLFVGGASFAIFEKAKLFLKGNGLDIGAGFWEFPGSTPIDLFRGVGYENHIDDYAENSVDYVFSSHCLEHISDWEKELKLWISKLKKGGRLFLYLPHPSCEIWLPHAPGIGDGHKWIPDCEILIKFLESLEMKIMFIDEGPDSMMSFSICAEKVFNN